MIPFYYFLLVAFAFLFGIVDASFGMGYGTLLTPMLLIVGFNPLQVIPAVLISQLVGDFLTAFFHHRFENVNLSVGSKDLKVSVMLGALGLVASVIAVLIAVNLPALYLNLYIGISAASLGLLILAAKNRGYSFSWFRLLCIGSFASFNKSLSGGGYGPIVVTGQMLTGVEVKNAIGITALAEGVTCAVAVFMYFFIGKNVDWLLSILLLIGVALSSPVAALIVRKIESKIMKSIIGISTLAIGLLTIFKVLLF
jgi:uncharacterized membrane protein YfcA